MACQTREVMYVGNTEWAQHPNNLLHSTTMEVIYFPLKFIYKVQSSSNSLQSMVFTMQRWWALADTFMDAKVHFIQKVFFSSSLSRLEEHFSEDSGIWRFTGANGI